MSVQVELSADLLSRLEEEALWAEPHEACALLLGHADENGVNVTDIAFSANVTEGDPETTFEIDPTLYIRRQKEARQGGPQVVGVWHSHPDGKPLPSGTDRARSVEPGWLWIITAVNDGQAESVGYRADAHDPQVMHRAQITSQITPARFSSQTV